MSKFSGFSPGMNKSITARAADALGWLQRERPGAFAHWTEVWAAVTGGEVESADLTEVKKLRERGSSIKDILADAHGLEWCSHTEDRAFIRATAPGKDTLLNAWPRYEKAMGRLAERADRCSRIIEASPIPKTAETRAPLAAYERRRNMTWAEVAQAAGVTAKKAKAA